jgi:hypothetical protein
MSRLKLRRVLTTTPLARLHERRVEGKHARRPRPIPWAAFDRSTFPQAAVDLALDSYIKSAAGEYGAIEVYAQLTSAMALAGLPIDLVTASGHICTDEARHADYAMKMAALLTDADVTVSVDKDSLQAHWKHGTSLEHIDEAVLHVAAVSETVACALVSACLDRATDATARTLLANVLADEVNHAHFGWYYLSWRSPQWSRAERQRLADRMATNVMAMERRYWEGRDAPEHAAPAAHALGVLDSERQREAVRSVMEEEVVPALDTLGLGASHAWRLRERGASADGAPR